MSLMEIKATSSRPEDAGNCLILAHGSLMYTNLIHLVQLSKVKSYLSFDGLLRNYPDYAFRAATLT